ncbi:MAG TPA: hypothetical protein VHF26_04815, partial [Trebonia sp.]|nr:hypothetical protein [Trebonia sp.]
MSADNPTDTTANKPVPPAPAPAETDGSADVYDPDLDELADEALSRPPIDYDGEPVPAQGGGENQGGVPAASGSAGGQEGAGQGEAGPGVTGASVVREQGGLQPSESAGPLEQEGKPPGPVTADGGGEVYDPDLDELADEALSRPPIDYD